VADDFPSPSLGLTELPRLRLDELLQELLTRVHEVADSRERLKALLDAVVSVGSDLDLRTTLERIVAAACRLADAQYGALGVIGPDRMLAQFITHGINPQQQALIGDLPHGRGVLGLLIQHPHPVRMPDISKHPQSYGFPANHPVMRSFLGVPVVVKDRIFGNLYLSEKRDEAEFTESDEEIVVALAAAAGVAIDNAQIFAESSRRQRWLQATAEIIDALLGQVHRTTALRLVARRAREVAEAQLVLVLLYDDDTGQCSVEVLDEEPDAGHHLLDGAVIDVADTALAEPLTVQRPALVEDLGKAADWPVDLSTGAALLVPLASAGSVLGVLAVAHRRGGPVFDDSDEIDLLTTFAGQAALALERARAQEEREMLMVLEDRESIARDLHDVVIQRLFATGLQLQSVARLARPEVSERINATVDDLDNTIRDIRSAIFELRAPVAAELRTDIRATVDAAASSLGFRPELALSGPLDSVVPDEIRPDLLAVLREALSNIVRHARAQQVDVRVGVSGHRLTLVVADNGVGCGQVDERSGLLNMRQRAQAHGGEFTVRPGGRAGTVVEWSVPV